MRILIVGGSAFVGRAITHAAVAHGHEVAVINRGVTESDLPAGVERLVGDRAVDLAALRARTFDATVDCVAYRPRDVEVLFDALGERGGQHLQISSISAYAEPDAPGATEDSAELWSDVGLDLDGPVTGETYGPLKAACERAARERFGDDATIVRPTYVIGGHDATLRFPYWVQRARRGGRVAVPGPRESAMQWIDARDLATFVVHLLDTRTTGAFHAAGPSSATTFTAMVERVVHHVAPDDATVEVVDASRVLDAGLAAKFPLWSGLVSANALAVDNTKGVANGLVLRPLEESVDDVLTWWGDDPWPAHWLSADEERALLA